MKNDTQITNSIISDLALTALMAQKPSGCKSAVLARIVAGNLNDLEPEEYRDAMANLVKYSSRKRLDVLGELLGLPRGVTEYAGGHSEETDNSFSERLLAEIRYQRPCDGTENPVGISLRTVLHFHSASTLAQQDAAVEKVIKAVEKEIGRIKVGQTLRVNELWVVVRFTSQDIVIDAGEPNRPFQEILLWRGGNPQPLVDNYVVQPGERLVIERSIPVPIDIWSAA